MHVPARDPHWKTPLKKRQEAKLKTPLKVSFQIPERQLIPNSIKYIFSSNEEMTQAD